MGKAILKPQKVIIQSVLWQPGSHTNTNTLKQNSGGVQEPTNQPLLNHASEDDSISSSSVYYSQGDDDIILIRRGKQGILPSVVSSHHLTKNSLPLPFLSPPLYTIMRGISLSLSAELCYRNAHNPAFLQTAVEMAIIFCCMKIKINNPDESPSCRPSTKYRHQ